ncbi:MAG: LysR family transcriptional regulator, partial [Rhodospirillaceae bacterium]
MADTDETDDDASRPHLKVRLQVGGGVIGPGKIRLLELLDSVGSISGAAKAMGLSYRRGFLIIETIKG